MMTTRAEVLSDRPVNVHAVGAYGPLGLSALQITMCARARKLVPRPTSFVDKRGESVGVCLADGIAEDVHGPPRLLALARPALREAVHRARIEAIPLVLSLPEAGRPDDDPCYGEFFVKMLAAASEVPIDIARSRVVRAGHAGGALAMEAAIALLHGAPAVLVGGVDSYHHPDLLRWLDEECRLHALDAENGFIPGEGAAFALLSRDRTGRLPAPIAAVLGCASGREESDLHDEPNIAASMTSILGRLLDGASTRPGWVLCDVNGERHRVREWNLCAVRHRLIEGVVTMDAPGDLGDIGAATGAMLLALAAVSWSVSAAPSPTALVALSSDAAERGAFLLAEVR
ncbi:hypothetical protein [Polyangium sorediatum]|uniref:Beta-ketoacyl synthase N-terminal domain-containing protein n=1 Tax=Polyangium sorediatum TaxID=889274 RepID=A0ABT6P9J0_9BACT|nr:hypothetical protein [Polyangium sorediatum]MDI1437284.1 hypothetical protein [Polyangium sorediatum]